MDPNEGRRRGEGALMARVKPEMSLEEIAAAEGTSVNAIHTLISRALKKLRAQKLIFTARELSIELEAHRATAHSLSRPRSAKKGGSA
jgi:predicted DNA-binding protein YlxM (UPF0122 family)